MVVAETIVQYDISVNNVEDIIPTIYVSNASMIHPNHTLLPVSQPVLGIPVTTTVWPYSSALPTVTYTPPMWSTYIPYRQPTLSITYEYKNLAR
ncbi:unnamed protein product [Rotaria socialis]